MQEMEHPEPAINWLLQSEDPSIRYLTLTELLDKPEHSTEVESARKQIIQGPKVQRLLSGQRRNGGFSVHPYQKWTGAHWRLVSLVELGIPSGFKPAVKATDLILKWLLEMLTSAMFQRSTDYTEDARPKKETDWLSAAV